MCQGALKKSETEGWDFLEELTEKTLQWKNTRGESFSARINSQNGGIHAVPNTTYVNTRFVALQNMLKGFVLSQSLDQFPSK